MFEGIEQVNSKQPGLPGPIYSLEFRRVEQLRRRQWNEDNRIYLVDSLTRQLARSNGKMRLRHIQAAALHEIKRNNGFFGPIVVGGGKTLITLLAPVLCEVERPVLLLPAQLRDQTLTKVLPAMHEHWKLHPNLRIIGYSELSLEKNASMLEDIDPDMIIADECHFLKNTKSGRTRRISRFMRQFPNTRFIAVSGTIASHSIMDFWHLIQWALKPANAPVPTGWNEAKEWAQALDERVPAHERLRPGALTRFCAKGESPRQGYRRRLTETPGVIATSEDDLGTSLQVWRVTKPEPVLAVKQLVGGIQENWETPSGEVLMEAIALWRHVRTAVLGFYYEWSPQPPWEWLEARKDWNKFVRHTLRNNRRRLDTPLQVWNECERSKIPVREHVAWKSLKDSYKPNSIPVWEDDYMLKHCAKWLKKGPGICWTEHTAFGEALAKMTGYPYFGAGNSEILESSGPVIASIAAHGTGKNLQQWDRNLVVCPPTSGATWEQLLGRTHRRGQKSDTVTFEVMQHHESYVDAMSQAVADAVFLEQTLGNKQRLLFCDGDVR